MTELGPGFLNPSHWVHMSTNAVARWWCILQSPGGSYCLSLSDEFAITKAAQKTRTQSIKALNIHAIRKILVTPQYNFTRQVLLILPEMFYDLQRGCGGLGCGAFRSLIGLPVVGGYTCKRVSL